MLILTKKDIIFGIMAVLIITCSIMAPITINSEIRETMSLESDVLTVVIDAGHGEPDGGAVSESGVKESTLNLEIAKKVQEQLEEEGIKVIMTREDENHIADEGKESIREIKVSDINNRIEIANNSNAVALISIHMNKYPESKYKGWQTFYNKASEKGKKLAEYIQAAIKERVGIENNREALKIEGIKLIDKSKITAVVVECGFLSNPDELNLLQTESYQEKLAEGICKGVINFLLE